MRIEALRIAGEKIGANRGAERSITVRNPYTREVVGSVPKATLAEVRRAYAIAHAFKPRLSRFERSNILHRAAALVRERVEAIAALISTESGLCLKDTRYEAGRVFCSIFCP